MIKEEAIPGYNEGKLDELTTGADYAKVGIIDTRVQNNVMIRIFNLDASYAIKYKITGLIKSGGIEDDVVTETALSAGNDNTESLNTKYGHLVIYAKTNATGETPAVGVVFNQRD